MKDYLELIIKENETIKKLLKEISDILVSNNDIEEKLLIKEMKKKVSNKLKGYEIKSLAKGTYEIKKKKETNNDGTYIHQLIFEDKFNIIRNLFKNNKKGYESYINNMINRDWIDLVNVRFVKINNDLNLEIEAKKEGLFIFYEDLKNNEDSEKNYFSKHFENNKKLIVSEINESNKDTLINFIQKMKDDEESYINNILDSILLNKDIDNDIIEDIYIKTDYNLKTINDDFVKINILEIKFKEFNKNKLKIFR